MAKEVFLLKEKKMAYRTGNYTAFYANVPFNESNLGASATKDFVTYNSITKNSRVLREEIDFGVNNNGLPVIVIYPEYSEKTEPLDYYWADNKALKKL
jgi:hypothetical protein